MELELKVTRLGGGPILGPRPDLEFDCPFMGRVKWAEKDVFNPAAVVMDGKVHLLFRAEDRVGRFEGVSRIGHAVSEDGISFEVDPEPVLFPAMDGFEDAEWEGGCEDPRVVELPDGRFLMTYSAYSGVHCILHLATSTDLVHWTKHGHAFGPEMKETWSKSGALVTELVEGRLVAKKILGKFWMHFGEGAVYSASSEDGIHWIPVKERYKTAERTDGSVTPPRYTQAESAPFPRIVLGIRQGRFDSRLTEPGPPSVWQPQGIVMLYNGSCPNEKGPAGRYSVGAALMDPLDPSQVVGRMMDPILQPEEDYELQGQVGEVTFAEGLVHFDGQWLLYYGTADSLIGVAQVTGLG